MSRLSVVAVLLAVALAGLSMASRAGEVAARKSEAALVADRVLSESIVTTNWNRNLQTGTVRQGLREFAYTMRNEPWNQDPNQNAMRLLSVEVKYAAQGRELSLRLSTLVNNAPPAQTASTP